MARVHYVSSGEPIVLALVLACVLAIRPNVIVTTASHCSNTLQSTTWPLPLLHNTSSSTCLRHDFQANFLKPDGIVIAALLPLREAYLKNQSLDCSGAPSLLGVQLVEALRLAIESALADSLTARRLVRALEIRDSCDLPRVGSFQAVQFAERSPVPETLCRQNLSTFSSPVCHLATERIPIVIGPGESGLLQAVSSVLGGYEIPHISYLGPSDAFTDKTSYPYLFRTSPSDRYEANAIVELLKKFHWTYVSVLTSEDNLLVGHFLDVFYETLLSYSSNVGNNRICISYQDQFRPGDETKVRHILERIARNSASNVVVLLLDEDHTESLLHGLSNLAMGADNSSEIRTLFEKRHLIWIGTEGAFAGVTGVTRRISQIPGEHTLLGVAYQPPARFRGNSEDFNEKLILRLLEMSRSIGAVGDSSWLSMLRSSYIASGNKTGQLASMLHPLVFSGSIAIAAKAAIKLVEKTFINCSQDSTNSCIHDVTGATLRSFLRELQLNCYNGDDCKLFDEDQDIFPAYTFLSAQWRRNSTVVTTIGHWSPNNGSHQGEILWRDCAGRLSADATPCVSWNGEAMEARLSAPESVCSKPCVAGQYQLANSRNSPLFSACCWTCVSCNDTQMFSPQPDVACSLCNASEGLQPNENHTGCVPKQLIYWTYDKPVVIALVSVQAVFALLVLGTLVIYYKWQDSIVVHIAYYHFSLVTLLILFLGMVLNVFTFWKPSNAFCTAFVAVMPLIVVASCLCLLIRAFHLIYRHAEECPWSILTKISQLCCSQCRRQFITLLVLCILIVGVFLATSHVGELEAGVVVREEERYLECKSTEVVLIGRVAIILVVLLCTDVVAFLARKFHDEDREDMLILLCAIALTFLWISLLPVSFLVPKDILVLFLGIILLATLLIVWGLLFATRLYIILLRPARNQAYPSKRYSISAMARKSILLSGRSSFSVASHSKTMSTSTNGSCRTAAPPNGTVNKEIYICETSV